MNLWELLYQASFWQWVGLLMLAATVFGGVRSTVGEWRKK